MTVMQTTCLAPAHDPLLGCRCRKSLPNRQWRLGSAALFVTLGVLVLAAAPGAEPARNTETSMLPTGYARTSGMNTHGDEAQRCPEFEPLLVAYGLPAVLSEIMWRESRCLPWVVNSDRHTGDLSYGLLQINTLGRLWPEVRQRCEVTHREDLLVPATNIRCAAALHHAYGLRPWR